MKKIIILTDYKDNFGSKWNSVPYRSGLDKKYLKKLFSQAGYDVNFIEMSNVDFNKTDWNGQVMLYTSSEEYGLYYKSFIEDIVFGLQNAGAILLPDPLFLRANNNKVFMEILRKTIFPKENLTLDAGLFGTYEELLKLLQNNKINYPCVIKKSAGAMSRGVFLANDEKDLIRKAKKISYTAPLTVFLKEKIRCLKHKGYKKESSYQNKFIIQPFVENLKNDWKVLIYGNKYFVLKRNVRKNDFRASGSGYNYSSGKEADFPENMLDFLKEHYCKFKVPNLSVDFAYDGKKGYIFEFQAIYFGTSTQYKSKEYFEEINGKWEMKPNNLDQEQIFVDSIVSFLRKY